MRETLSPYDLMFCIGSDVLRMSVFSETDPMPEGMAVIQLGLRDWEMDKNYPAEVGLLNGRGAHPTRQASPARPSVLRIPDVGH